MDFKELREQLTDEMLKSILIQFDVEPVMETAESIIFPTCCHNRVGGSPKLYYYKNSKLFHCYTECGETFDIFTLLQKMYKLRGEEISLRQAVSLCDLDATHINPEDSSYSCIEDIKYMQSINNFYIPDVESLDFKVYDNSILRKFSFDYLGLMPWIKEGIGIEALQKFNIKYDSFRDAIVIPNFDYNGKLIGVRERFLKPQDVLKGKYRPLFDNGVLYNHPTGRTFYDIYENHKAIEKKKMCIIVEGEKGVLCYDTMYGSENNITLATLGQNITRDHIQYLLKMGVRTVVLAYDTDYEDYEQLRKVEQKYIDKANVLAPYFNVSILMDYDFVLPHKSSPVEGGKEVFEKLLRDRRVI